MNGCLRKLWIVTLIGGLATVTGCPGDTSDDGDAGAASGRGDGGGVSDAGDGASGTASISGDAGSGGAGNGGGSAGNGGSTGGGSSAGKGGAGGGDAPLQPGDVFNNEPAAAFGALEGMAYRCDVPGAVDGYFIGLRPGSVLDVAYYESDTDEQPDRGTGSYSTSASGVTFDIPDLDFNFTSDKHAFALGRVVALQFSAVGLECTARALNFTTPGAPDIFKCPTIHFVPGAGFDNNEFHIAADGSVLRRRWNEITVGDGDTLYREFRGVWVVEQGYLFMVFPAADDPADQQLNGPVSKDLSEFTVLQLEPDKGPCTLL